MTQKLNFCSWKVFCVVMASNSSEPSHINENFVPQESETLKISEIEMYWKQKISRQIFQFFRFHFRVESENLTKGNKILIKTNKQILSDTPGKYMLSGKRKHNREIYAVSKQNSPNMIPQINRNLYNFCVAPKNVFVSNLFAFVDIRICSLPISFRSLRKRVA